MQLRESAPKDLLPKGAVSLRLRLFLTLTIALAPVAAVSLVQGMERARIEVANVHERLLQSAQMAASHEENVLGSSEQLLAAIGNIDDVRNVTPECDRALIDALIGVRFLTNLSRIDSQGVVVCSALKPARGMRIGNLALFKTAKATMAYAVSNEMQSQVTHGPVIGAMLPLRDSRGNFNGAVAAGINALWLDFILRARNLPNGAVVALFDRGGSIIASNNLPVAGTVFSRIPKASTLRGGLESRSDANGNSWTFAAAPLVGDNVFVGFAMREARLFIPTYVRVSADFLLPIVMIGLAWAGIWFATDRQVTQWIVYLRRVAAAYRAGHYRLKPSLRNAPAEFKLLGSAMEDMAAGIQDRDGRLRQAVAQKTMQVRETHHRVKNNLQVVMSLLSLQAAQSRDPTVRDALTQAQARIGALALVHRLLNEVEDQTSVDLHRLLSELTGHVVEGSSLDKDDIEVSVDVPVMAVPGEMAVPLALFAVEALANIFKHAFPSSRPKGVIRVALNRRDAGFCLSVEDEGVGFRSDTAKTGIGGRLLNIFGQQVNGHVSIKSELGGGTKVELTFPDFLEPKQESANAGPIRAHA